MTPIKYLPYFFAVCFPLVSISQHPEIRAQDGWEFEKEKYNVKVFSKNISGYEVEAFKASGLVDAPIESVYKIVMDIENYTEWYPNCKIGEVLNEPNELEQFRRIEFKLPWPFANRDAVNKMVVTKMPDSIWIDIINKAEYLPKLKNVYRVGRTEGYWSIVKEKEDQTRLTYSAIGEPGGIPVWIINIFLFDSPLEAVNNIREMVMKPEYIED
ncbi:MAG: START domain-containing protein [Bacteroidota bacterium]